MIFLGEMIAVLTLITVMCFACITICILLLMHNGLTRLEAFLAPKKCYGAYAR